MKMTYKIVGHESSIILTSMVNDLLNAGWKLSGGLCIGKGMFWQSMYLEETKLD